MRKLKYVKFFENFLINEDILELNSLAKKIYSFLKENGYEVSLIKEMNPETRTSFYYFGGKKMIGDIFSKDKDSKGQTQISNCISIEIHNSFPGVNFSHKIRESGPFISIKFGKYARKGVDKIIKDFISKFPNFEFELGKREYENDFMVITEKN